MSAQKRKNPEEASVPDAITSIAVKGFKSLAEECSIEVRPLTILAGANSSGKSSIMQPLLLMKQTLEAPYEAPGPLLFDGPNVRFWRAEELFSRLKGREPAAELVVRLAAGQDWGLNQVFSRRTEGFIELAESNWITPGGSAVLRPGMTEKQVRGAVPAVYHEIEASLVPTKRAGKRNGSQWSVERHRCLLEASLTWTDQGDHAGTTGNLWFPGSEGLEALIVAALHVPGLRGNPQRTYTRTAAGPEYPGRFEDYTASVVLHWIATGDPNLGRLARMLKALGLTSKVEARLIDDTHVEVRVGRLPAATRGGEGDMVNIADVGFGVSQALPVLVALLAAEPGQVVYLEEPELHLHPRAQVRLATVLAKAAKRGVRVVAETHSALLLLAVQTLVAEGELDPNLVALHWFQRRSSNGVTKVTRAHLDDTGSFGDWPVDFSDEELRLTARYLGAVDQKLGLL